MDISIFLAQVFGLYFVIAGVAIIVRPAMISRLIETLSNRNAMYMTGFIALLLGIPLVLLHNIWDGSWRVIITVLVWLTLLKGVVRLFAPDTIVNWSKGLADKPSLIRLLVWFMTIFGLYLIYIGFDLSALR